jgi:hypothetical protein
VNSSTLLMNSESILYMPSMGRFPGATGAPLPRRPLPRPGERGRERKPSLAVANYPLIDHFRILRIFLTGNTATGQQRATSLPPRCSTGPASQRGAPRSSCQGRTPAARGRAPLDEDGVGHVACGASVDVAVRARTSRPTHA